MDVEKKWRSQLPKRADVYAAVTMGEALAHYSFEHHFSAKTELERNIDTVTQETDSRAVALVRSLIPWSSGA